MAELFEYKCPNCGGSLQFDGGSQKLKCPYCDSEIDVEALSAYDEELNKDQAKDEMDWQQDAGTEWGVGETDGMKVYVCKSCGGEIIAEEAAGATKCPYCDNPIVMKGAFTGSLKPDFIIPFKKDKNQAKEAYLRHLEGKKLLPKVFRDQNHIDEIKGVYVPFWLYDCDVDARVRYQATKTRSWSDSNNNYVETSYFAVSREGNIGFDNVPVDGSVAMPDDLMQSIEPYDFSDAVDFKTAYLAGYLADKYTVNAEDSIAAANARIKRSTEDAFRDTVRGYSSVSTEASSIRISNGDTKYALYPVWILNTTYDGQKYTFAMNGQTGKIVGNLPVDKGAFWRNFGLIGGIAAAAAFAVQALAYVL